MNKLEVKQIIEKAKKMDKASEEFSDLYFGLNELYFDFKEPDGYQSAGKILNLVINKGEEWMVEACAKIANELFKIVNEDQKASHGSFQIEDKKMFFYDFYQNKDAIEQIHKMFRNAVIMKAKE